MPCICTQADTHRSPLGPSPGSLPRGELVHVDPSSPGVKRRALVYGTGWCDSSVPLWLMGGGAGEMGTVLQVVQPAPSTTASTPALLGRTFHSVPGSHRAASCPLVLWKGRVPHSGESVSSCLNVPVLYSRDTAFHFLCSTCLQQSTGLFWSLPVDSSLNCFDAIV